MGKNVKNVKNVKMINNINKNNNSISMECMNFSKVCITVEPLLLTSFDGVVYLIFWTDPYRIDQDQLVQMDTQTAIGLN